MIDPFDESMAAICRRADDLHARTVALLDEADRVLARMVSTVERQEREERDEAAIEAATTIAGRM